MTIRLNVCMPVPDPWASYARGLAKELESVGNIIDLSGCVPHVTLFLASFPEDAVQDATARLNRVAARNRAVETEVNEVVRHSGYVFLKIELTAVLRDLHEAIIEELSTARGGLVVQSERLRVAASNPELLPLMDRYGSVRVGNEYVPHLTVGKLPDGAAIPRLDGNRPERSLRCEHVALGLAGDHGVVHRLLHERRLGDSSSSETSTATR